MWEENPLVRLCERLKSGALWPEHMSHTRELWGWSRDRHVCACFESRSGCFRGNGWRGWESVDAHHMGSCGPRASVGGWAPVGTGLCCSRSDPWRPAAAAAVPAVWRSSSSPPSDWTSPLQSNENTQGGNRYRTRKNRKVGRCRRKPRMMKALLIPFTAIPGIFTSSPDSEAQFCRAKPKVKNID